MLSPFSAAGPAAGFGYQLIRGLHHLVTCKPGEYVGVETDDDVVLRGPDGLKIMEQDKRSLQHTGHPFQDSSRGLWKTLRIWTKAYVDGNPEHRRAHLHFVTNRPVPTDTLVRKLSNAKSDQEVDDCVDLLRSVASDCKSEKVAKIMKAVLDSGDNALRSVVLRSSLFDAACSVDGDELREETINRLQLHPEIDGQRVVQALLGWMHDTLDHLWRAGREGWLGKDAFLRQRHAIVNGLRVQHLRIRAERLVPVSENDRVGARQRSFVEHILRVDVAEMDLDNAIDSFVRFSSERLRLEAEGDIGRHDWEDFFDSLEGRWKRIRRRNLRRDGTLTRTEIGREILYDTTDQDYTEKLAGIETRYYFTCGGYHRLADEDKVYWHPDFPTASPPSDDS